MNISRHQDDEGRRHYTTESGKDVYSVTTILDQLEKPVELTEWQERNNGEGDNANHEHLLWYKANRGTLLHYEVLSMFEDSHEQTELYSEDEASSEEELFDNHSPSKTYSVMKDKRMLSSEDEFKTKDVLPEIYEEDKEMFEQIFNVIAIRNGINSDTVREIEKMFIVEPEEGIKYGGQIDMVYEKDGKTIVADLKTSSGVRDKHLLQGAAYAKALDEEDVVVQVIRIHPDSGDFEVKEMEGDEVEEKWQEFKSLAREAYK